MKQCTKCKKEKTYAAFHRQKGSSDGYRASCRQCRKKEYSKPPEQIAAWKKWRIEHMRQMGLASKGRKVSEQTKKKWKKSQEKNWANHDYDAAAINRCYYNYRRRGYTGNREDFIKMSTSNCFYCGSPPLGISSSGRQTKHGAGAFQHNTLDRFDNSKGYEKENIVAACKKCNHAKWTYSFEEFKQWITKVAQHLNNLT